MGEMSGLCGTLSAMTALDDYREAARERGIPEHIVDWAMRLARPRLELRPMDDSDAPVVGQYGGLPSLPPDVEWSGFPDFIGSVDCAAVPVGKLDIPLPKDGTLLFFATRREPPFVFPTGGRVVYVPAGTATAERIASEEDIGYTREPFPLRGRLNWNMPDLNSAVIIENDELGGVFEEHGLGDLNYSTPGELTLGGYACTVQDDPCLAGALGDDDERWVMMAQARYQLVDIPTMVCHAFWMIRHQDLTDRNFERVKFVIDAFASSL
jgi:hypothetical protein